MTQEHDDPIPVAVVATSPESRPLQPPWIAEASLILEVGAATSVREGLRDRVRVPRGRMGTYEACDFFLVLILYAVSHVASIKEFDPALRSWWPALAAQWFRAKLPGRSTLSRFLSAVTEKATEGLRAVLFEDLLAQGLRGELLGRLGDREGIGHLLFDVDGKKQGVRQRSVIEDEAHPPVWRRLGVLSKSGYLGRKRGEGVRTRSAVQQAHTHEWLGTWGAAGNGTAFADLAQACAHIKRYLIAHGWDVARGVLRLDGLYGVVPAVASIAAAGMGWLVRTNDQRLWKRAEVLRAMTAPEQATFKQPDTGTEREVIDVGWIDWVAAKDPALAVRTRLVLTRRTLRPGEKLKVGHLVGDVVFELFATDRDAPGWHAADVVDLYFARGGFEQTLAEEDREQALDRWVSGNPCGQECWQLLAQWVWNVRLRLGVAARSPEPRCTLWSPAFPLAANDNHGGSVTLPTPPSVPVSDRSVPGSNEPVSVPCHQGTVAEAAGRGAGKYGGRDFCWTAPGELTCPAGIVLRPGSRRLEGDRWRVLYVAPSSACAACARAPRCRGGGSGRGHGRTVSVFVPAHPSTAEVPSVAEIPLERIEEIFRPARGSKPLLWVDLPATMLRGVLRVEVRNQQVELLAAEEKPRRPRLTRAQRAHRRLSWSQRVARNAHPPLARPWQILVYGVPPGIEHYLAGLHHKTAAA